MKKLTIVLGLIAVAALLLTGFASDENTQSQKITGHSFAVVELFTSEGCSSCPPADELLSEIVKDARQQDKHIFALAFHVDYWNYLGWKDIYSDPRFSQRQRAYAKKLDTHVYTPQMVVNGKHQFVGSNSHKAQSTIEQELESSKSIPFSITTNWDTDDKSVHIQYRFDQLPMNAELQLALVERGLVRDVKRGENRGRTLRHENVVRAFDSIRLRESQGDGKLRFPKEVDLEKASVIAYVQKRDSGEIISARRSDF